MRVALLYNSEPPLLAPHLPEDEYEECDSDLTIQAIAGALEQAGLAVEPVSAERDLAQRLDRGYEFVFNIAEGHTSRRCREAVPAAVCELLGLPYTGSDPLTLAATLDKSIARRIVSPDVPIARAVTRFDACGSLTFPVIVKPNDEGSSKGIRAASYCRDIGAAERQVEWLTRTYRCPILIEEWLPGAEVTVAIAGNGDAARVLAMMEIGFSEHSAAPFLYSLEVKRAYKEQVGYRVPPSLPDSTLRTLEDSALTAYHLLGCRDIARFDFRLDAEGVPRFLECNPLPGLHPESGDIVIATRGILRHDELIQNIFIDAAARYGIQL